jgi:hypothetical protein
MKTFIFSQTSFLYLLFAGMLALSACRKDENKKDNPTPDTSKPVITVIRPAMNASFASGTDMQLEVRFTDDRALSQARVEIHFNDGHSHKAEPIDTAFVIPLSGTMQTVTRSFKLDSAKAAGPYHLIIDCVDQSGNKADFVEVDFEITSPKQPKFSDLKINDEVIPENDELHLEFKGNSTIEARLTGNLTAAAGGLLDEAEMKIYEGEGHSHKTSAFSLERKLAVKNRTTFTINELITFPASAFNAGDNDYILYLKAKDQSGHMKVFQGKLHIKK